MDMKVRYLYFVIAFLCVSTVLLAQSDAASCPMQIDSIKLSSSVAGIGSFMGGHTDTGGKLAFKYKNLSGRNIRSITLHLSGRMQVSGPTGPSFVDTTKNVVFDGPILANTSKKASVKIPSGIGNLMDAELYQVQFSDGELWQNDKAQVCVLNSSTGNRR